MTDADGGPAARHDALLERVAREAARLDGRPAGGALLGPHLLFLAAADRLPDERLVRLGTAVELLRRATLVHRAPKRETRWTGYGDTPFSQTLRGDSLLAESFRMLAADGDPRTVSILSRAMAAVSEGELAAHDPDGADGEFRRQAAYYEGAAAAGAAVAEWPGDVAQAFVLWAREVGEARERIVAGESAAPPGPCPLPRRAPWDAELWSRLNAPDTAGTDGRGEGR